MRVRVSAVDVVSGLLFLVAIGLLVRPGSAARATFERWLTVRRISVEAEKHWPALSELSTPLFSGHGEPDIIEFIDYECLYCRLISPSVDSAVEAGVRVGVVHVPAPTRSSAKQASLVALCAAQVGRYPDVHRYLMSTEDWRNEAGKSLIAAIGDSGESAAVEKCLEDSAAEPQIAASAELAERIGIVGTPMFVAKGRVLTDALSAENLTRFARER